MEYFGVDLTYSVNKTSYNLIEPSKLSTFCQSAGIKNGTDDLTTLVSFGEDRYGVAYRRNTTTTTTTTEDDAGDDAAPQTSDREFLSGFTFEKGEFKPLPQSVQDALSSVTNYSSSVSNVVLCNTPSSQQIVLFDNTSSQFKTIDLFEKTEAEKYSSSSDSDSKSGDDAGKAELNGAGAGAGAGDDQNKDKDKDKDKQKDEDAEEVKVRAEEEESDEVQEKGISNKEKAAKGTIAVAKYKVKSSLRKVFRHLFLTSNGSLYGLQKSFHKKYVNNNRVVEVKCDGSRCTLCLDENGVLWSFGINMFGKLGLRRNDKKTEYTNPREISIFKAYKVADFGVTNKCCIACCANGSVYGWGSVSRSSTGKDSDIWWTPQLISTDDLGSTVSLPEPSQKAKWRAFAGVRFIILLNTTSNELYVVNTQFGFTLLDKPKNGFVIRTQPLRLPENVTVTDVIPSAESAIIVVKKKKV